MNILRKILLGKTGEGNSVTNEILEEKIKDGSITILDVRGKYEYDSGHIPGSVFIPLNQLEDRAEELDKDDEIYIVCYSGSRASVARKILSNNGFNNVKSVVPGMRGWKGKLET